MYARHDFVEDAEDRGVVFAVEKQVLQGFVFDPASRAETKAFSYLSCPDVCP